MSKIMSAGPFQLAFLDKDESILVFRDIPSAMIFLRRFKDNPVQMSILRGLVATGRSGLSRMGTEEVLKSVASLLVTGEIKILRSFDVRGSTGQAQEDAEKKEQGAKGSLPPGRKTDWIEIRLRDMEGQPVQGKKFKIRTPDGSLREGTLDAFGHVEYYDLNPGTCQVSFPELDADAWELFPGGSTR